VVIERLIMIKEPLIGSAFIKYLTNNGIDTIDNFVKNILV